jgi:hypothetical protein
VDVSVAREPKRAQLAHAIVLGSLGRTVLGHRFGRIRRLLLAVLEHGFCPGAGSGIGFLGHDITTRNAQSCSLAASPS